MRWTTCVRKGVSHGVRSTPDRAGVVRGRYVSHSEWRPRARDGATVGRERAYRATRTDADEHADEHGLAVHAGRDRVRRIQPSGWPSRWQRARRAELVDGHGDPRDVSG